jgi:DNA-binding phage protein
MITKLIEQERRKAMEIMRVNKITKADIVKTLGLSGETVYKALNPDNETITIKNLIKVLECVSNLGSDKND